MKKRLLICLFTILAVVTITGCGKKEDKNLKDITLKDEGYGTTVLKYNKDKDYEIKEQKGGKYNELLIESKSDNFALQIYHTDTHINSYNAGKENRSQSPGYKEYNWNGFSGYIYNANEYGLNFNILLKEKDGNAKVLFGSMDPVDFQSANILRFFTSDDFQKVMNSITFEE